MKLCEVYDKETQSAVTAGVRDRADKRKTSAEKRRVKAVGGGETAPAKEYKPRKDRGVQGAGRGTSTKREQQPEKERGTAGLSPKEQQRKAYKERKARESGAKTKTASELLAKKSKPKVDPDYKVHKGVAGAGPSKKSYTHKERKKLKTHGEKILKNEFKKQETEKYKQTTGQNPTGKAKTKVLAQVSRRMSS